MRIAKPVIITKVPTGNAVLEMIHGGGDRPLRPYLEMACIEAHSHRVGQVGEQLTQISPRVVRDILNRQTTASARKFLTESRCQHDIASERLTRDGANVQIRMEYRMNDQSLRP